LTGPAHEEGHHSVNDPRGLLAGMLDGTFTRMQRVLTDISEEDGRAGAQGLTPIVWQVGHVALTDSRALTRLGLPVPVPGTYEALFTTGTGGQADYPPLDLVMPVMAQVNAQLRTLALEGNLDQAIEGTRSYRTAGEAIVFLIYHRGYHIGKITTLRALLKKEGMFG